MGLAQPALAVDEQGVVLPARELRDIGGGVKCQLIARADDK